jgi:tetratricopeptide (TPR) repeat protein
VLAGKELTKQLISQIESGQTRPSPTTLALIADRLGVTVPTLVGPDVPLVGTADGEAAYSLRFAEAMLAARQPERARETLRNLNADRLTGGERVIYHRLHADLELSQGNAKDALGHALTACRYAGTNGDPEQVALAHNAAGRAHFLLNHVPAAISYYDAAVDFAALESVDPAVLARIQTNRGNALMRIGVPTAAAEAYERAGIAAERAENLRALALAHMGIGEAFREAGDHTAAIARMETAVELFDRLENRRLQVQTLHNLGEALGERGDLATARRQHEAALAAATTIGDTSTRGYALERLAAYDIREGGALKALRGAQEAIAIARETKDGYLLARALATFAVACPSLGDSEQADDSYAAALSEAGEAGGRALRLVLLQQGAMLRDRGDHEAASKAFEAAARSEH